MIILKEGIIRNRYLEEEESYVISILEPGHKDELVELDRYVLEHLPRRDLYLGLTEEEFEYNLSGGGVVLGLSVQDRLVGFYTVYFPGDREDNLGLDMGLPKEELELVAHMEATVVLADYSGNGLQRLLAHLCLEEARKRRTIKHLYVTVSPFNYPSVDHMFALNMAIVALKEKYGGMLRYIGSREMDREPESQWEEVLRVDIEDFQEQETCLKGGFVGFRMIREKERNYLDFGRMK